MKNLLFAAILAGSASTIYKTIEPEGNVLIKTITKTVTAESEKDSLENKIQTKNNIKKESD